MSLRVMRSRPSFLFSSAVHCYAAWFRCSSLPHVVRSVVCSVTMATGRWLLLLPLLMEIVMAIGETDPPNYGSTGKHPNITITVITEMCFLKVQISFYISCVR